MSSAERDIRRKLRVLKYFEQQGNITETCRHFEISRQTFYSRRFRFEKDGESGLINHKPCPENPRVRVATANSQLDEQTDQGRTKVLELTRDGLRQE